MPSTGHHRAGADAHNCLGMRMGEPSASLGGDQEEPLGDLRISPKTRGGMAATAWKTTRRAGDPHPLGTASPSTAPTRFSHTVILTRDCSFCPQRPTVLLARPYRKKPATGPVTQPVYALQFPRVGM